ncbi:MAG: hypothetical protein JWM35_1274, partial [Verrucomicrobia bacterium]|nr:hypothetical protein [Verrucomicrobiota bacterium]
MKRRKSVGEAIGAVAVAAFVAALVALWFFQMLTAGRDLEV